MHAVIGDRRAYQRSNESVTSRGSSAPEPHPDTELIAVKRWRCEENPPANKRCKCQARTHTYIHVHICACRYLHAEDALDDQQNGKERMKHDVRYLHTQAYILK